MTTTSVADSERVALLDALRGFALLGVLLANIQYWSGWIMMMPPQQAALAGEGLAAGYNFLHRLLVDGKFYTLFSFLFGLGFSLQIARLAARGRDGIGLFRRRVLVLLGIGLVHSWLVWDGDILTLYALLGLVLPWFARWRDGALLLGAAALLLAVPPLGRWLFEALGWAPHESLFAWSLGLAEGYGVDTRPEQTVAWMASTDPAHRWAWMVSGPPYSWGLRLASWRIPKVLGVMLLGAWAGRRLLDGTLLADRRRLAAIAGLGALVGLPASFMYASAAGANQTHWGSELGTVPLAMAYAAAFALAWPALQPRLGGLVAVGRLALTNYLTHSVVGALVFYGIGLGQVGRWTPPVFVAFALALFAAQMLFSRAWLRHHAQGPMEALWRRAAFGAGGAR